MRKCLDLDEVLICGADYSWPRVACFYQKKERPPSRRLGREPIKLPGGWVVRVRYAPIATKFRGAAK
jgi:hypothetical protein